MINLSTKYLDKKINLDEIYDLYEKRVNKNHNDLNDKKTLGSEMLGWLDYPNKISKKTIEEIQNFANNFNNKNIKNLLIISIGGSYTALRAGIDMCLSPFNRNIKIYYAKSLSSNYLNSLKKKLEKKDFAIIIISKSGGTLEPAISLRIFYELMLKKYGVEESQSRTIAITSETNGSLVKIANNYNWKTFYIPDNIGGRFSCLTPAGLVPMAILGLDIKKIINGAKKAMKDCSHKEIKKNSAYKYAIIRHYLYSNKNKKIEVFGSYEEELFYFLEHLKQLFGESEGKNHKGLFPVVSRYTTDLHSMGQFYQEGSPIFFQTIIKIKNIKNNLGVEKLFDNIDGLNYLTNKKVFEINSIVSQSTMDSHLKGGNSTLQITIDDLNEESFGYLYYWFSKSVSMSALLLNLNPFNQPGVEIYKEKIKENFKSKK